jgi:ubiquinone/menaquinone biosynthesis C-methylase UbiE
MTEKKLINVHKILINRGYMRYNYKGIPINTSKNTHEVVYKLITKSSDSKIVDIPSGSGAFTLRLKDNGYNDVTAVDIENIMKCHHNDFIVGDMTGTLPLEDNNVDVLCCIDGIEHIGRQEDFIKEVNRVLKINGELIVSTPNISSLRSRWQWFLTGHHHKCNTPLDENNPNSLHHIGMVSFPELRYKLHTNGFIIQQVTTNRIKLISWLYALTLPIIYFTTSFAYYKAGKKEKTMDINNEIKKQMFSKSVLFGETLIVKAVKILNKI